MRAQAWAYPDLTAVLAGEDPGKVLVDRQTDYWQRALKKVVLATLEEFQMHGASPVSLRRALALLNVQPGLWVECARVFAWGSRKYAAWNWAKGQAWSIPLGSALRHIVLGVLRGEENDPESGETHRGHVACNLVMLLWFADHYAEGNDLRRVA